MTPSASASPSPLRLCTVCARGGSKGVPNKNLLEIGGRSLVAHSVAQARESGLFAVVGCSSDSPAILDAAAAAGADLLIRRPDALATDAAGKLETLHHALLEAEARTGLRFDTYADLDATSPLRAVADIAGAVALLERSGAASVLTGAPARRSPYFNLLEERPDGTVTLAKTPATPILRRQDAPRCFDMNASIYVWRAATFRATPAGLYPDTRLFEMPEDRSVDIDSPLDLEIVRMLMARREGGA